MGYKALNIWLGAPILRKQCENNRFEFSPFLLLDNPLEDCVSCLPNHCSQYLRNIVKRIDTFSDFI